MAKKSLVIEILGNNKLGRAVRDSMQSLRRLGGYAKSIGRGISRAFRLASVGAIASVGIIGAAIKTAFDFEAYRSQLKVLLGTTEAATDAFKTLADFSAKTPFQLGGIIEAYQQLQTFTDGALATKTGLELVGDAAAARQKDFSEVAYWVGRLYSALKNGDPFMDAVGALQRLGILGGTVRGELTELTKTGVNFGAKWAVVEGQLLRFTGGMKELSTTGKGLFSTLKDNWTLAVATFGDAFSTLAKDSMQKAIDAIGKLRESGQIEEWADVSAKAVERVVDALARLSNPENRTAAIADLKKMFEQASQVVKPKFEEWGEAAGRAIWKGFKSGGGKVVGAVSERAEAGLSSTLAGRVGRAFGPVSSTTGFVSAAAGEYSNSGSIMSALGAGFKDYGSAVKNVFAPGSSPSTPVYVSEVNPPEGPQ